MGPDLRRWSSDCDRPHPPRAREGRARPEPAQPPQSRLGHRLQVRPVRVNLARVPRALGAPLAVAARRLAGGDLSARVQSGSADEIGQLAAAFDDMAERLEQSFGRERALEAGRRELISAVSHDLRTPLATTRAMVEALADKVVTEPADVQRYLELILKETQHLGRLIDDLFELSQIDSGALRLRWQAIDLSLLVS